MGFWFWFAIFAGISVLGLASYCLLGLRIATKAKGLRGSADKLQALANAVQKSSERIPVIENLVPALDQDEQTVASRRRKVLKQRVQRKELKQRRLIARLSTMKIDESRLQKDA